MLRILVVPEALREMSGRLLQAERQLEEMTAHLRGVLRHLSWEVTVRQEVEERAAGAGARAARLSGQAGEMARFLARKVEQFLAADQSGADWLAQVGSDRASRQAAPGAGIVPEQEQETEPQSARPQPDGGHPSSVSGTTGTVVWRPTRPDTTSDPDRRSPDLYNRVIDQYAVEENGRYRVRDTSGDGREDTFCNIYVWDVTRAMGAPIPHWIERETGRPYPDDSVASARGYAEVSQKAYEMNANETARWLAGSGAEHGWHAVSAAEAQAWANQGKPAVAVWDAGQRTGHMAVVRPGTYDPDLGPAIAQAGSDNRSHTTVVAGFSAAGAPHVRYYVHD